MFAPTVKSISVSVRVMRAVRVVRAGGRGERECCDFPPRLGLTEAPCRAVARPLCGRCPVPGARCPVPWRGRCAAGAQVPGRRLVPWRGRCAAGVPWRGRCAAGARLG